MSPVRRGDSCLTSTCDDGTEAIRMDRALAASDVRGLILTACVMASFLDGIGAAFFTHTYFTQESQS